MTTNADDRFVDVFYPCPACGEPIETNAESIELNILTWCDRCPWFGWTADHLVTGDKDGAKNEPALAAFGGR